MFPLLGVNMSGEPLPWGTPPVGGGAAGGMGVVGVALDSGVPLLPQARPPMPRIVDHPMRYLGVQQPQFGVPPLQLPQQQFQQQQRPLQPAPPPVFTGGVGVWGSPPPPGQVIGAPPPTAPQQQQGGGAGVGGIVGAANSSPQVPSQQQQSEAQLAQLLENAKVSVGEARRVVSDIVAVIVRGTSDDCSLSEHDGTPQEYATHVQTPPHFTEFAFLIDSLNTIYFNITDQYNPPRHILFGFGRIPFWKGRMERCISSNNNIVNTIKRQVAAIRGGVDVGLFGKKEDKDRYRRFIEAWNKLYNLIGRADNDWNKYVDASGTGQQYRLQMQNLLAGIFE
jgi:hypothetical protein